MKCLTCNNYIDEEKDSNYSCMTLKMLTDKVRLLEKDLDKIKNKETNKKSSDGSISITIDRNNNKKINNNELEFKSKNNDTKSPKNLLLLNLGHNSYSCTKHKHRPKLNIGQIYKKLSNYNNIITEKKENLLKMTSHKRFNTNANLKDISEISRNKNKEFYKNYYDNNYNKKKLSNKKLNNIITLYDNNNNNNNFIFDKNNIKKLEYEFEIRNLRKTKKLLRNKNKEIYEKLNLIRHKNLELEKYINNKKAHISNIINNLFLLNKNYFIKKYSNEFDSIESNSYASITNNYNENSLKNILFNIMDTKLDYDTKILYNKFTQGICDLLNFYYNNNNNNNNKKICIHKIYNEINELINTKKGLEKNKKFVEEKNKYSVYLKSLLYDFNIQSLKKLVEVIHILFIKNIKENESMKQIKKALIKDNSTSKKENQSQKNIKNALNLKEISNHDIYSTDHGIYKNYTNINFHKNKRQKINLRKYNNNYFIKLEKEEHKQPKRIINRTFKNENKLNIYMYQNNHCKTLYENETRINNTSANKGYSVRISEDNKNNEKNISQKYYRGINQIYNKYFEPNNKNKNEKLIRFIDDNKENISDNKENIIE